MSTSIHELLQRRAAVAPDGPAVLGLDREPMSYAACLRQVEATAGTLATLGIGVGDRVAVVLPNGPEMAVCFLAVASVATCAPLNPAYRAQEFARYFDDLAPSALIVSAAEASPAREVAVARDIPILELAADPTGPAGAFRLSGGRGTVPPQFASANNIALVLHTSGTTSRPKMVPLSQANLCASAENIARSLQLTPADRCLCVMPLFHIHGLIGALLSTMSSGGSIVCPPGFMAPPFFDWIATYRPTWYTAVPTMHRAVLARAKQLGGAAAATSLRFVRSCSSALPPQLMAEFEAVLGVPVIEAYGMTEASHQMASNPLPPAARKPGSVGVSAGAEVAIMADDGSLLPPTATGEIVVRGPGVTSGYANDPEANATSFVNGWFRTGDQGFIDADGYVFINGRIKEIINRGGDKIAPREVDEALLAHPLVAEAVAFAMPDARLGEDVGAAVVLRPGATIEERELRDFAGGRIADFKVPRRFFFLDEIPKGPTGKLERLRMAQILGLTGEDRPVGTAAPTRPVIAAGGQQAQLAEIWRRILRVDSVAPADDFFESGGDSLSAVCLLAEIEERCGVRMTIADLFDAPSLDGFGKLMAAQQAGATERRLVRIQPMGANPAFFAIGAGPTMRELARRVGGDRPFLSPQYPDFDKLPQPCRLEDIAAYHVETMRAEQRHGPYFLGGWCVDGIVAYEVAQQLIAEGEEIGLLVMFDVPIPFGRQAGSGSRAMLEGAEDLLRKLGLHAAQMGRMRLKEVPSYFAGRVRAVGRMVNRKAVQLQYDARNRLNMPVAIRDGLAIQHRAAMLYDPRPIGCPLLVFRRTLRPGGRYQDPRAGWDELALGELSVIESPGDHRAMFLEPQVGDTAAELRSRLAAAQRVPVAA